MGGGRRRPDRWRLAVGEQHPAFSQLERPEAFGAHGGRRQIAGKGSPPIAAKAHANGAQTLRPNEDEIRSAIASLYKDEVKPYGRILRKRLSELAQVASVVGASIDVDAPWVRRICEQSDQIDVQSEESGEYIALLVGEEVDFVDVYSSEDIYPTDLWDAAAKFFGEEENKELTLPGGRYACAQALAALDLPFFANHSLGRVCHVVQLAISHRKVLGYLNGAIVPYHRSQSMMKDLCAEMGRACSVTSTVSTLSGATGGGCAGSGKSKLALASWDQARSCMRKILEDTEQDARSTDNSSGPAVPLSNVKRLFRSKFKLELSETALGHSKLSDLLADPRFGDVCHAVLEGRGYVVVPGRAPVASHSKPHVQQEHQQQQLQERQDMEQLEQQNCESPKPQQQLSCLDNDLQRQHDDRICCTVRHTFIHAGLPPMLSLPGAALRSRSVPKDMGSRACDDACEDFSYWPWP
eukprot:gnl/TRDRNA2_/TRDRNA2_31830_c0_seq1.p1 gnl/TRDRNA2_/TRDRNA2_31830_c0~~gnl/TRDRNA2_/TRDRNA2_31830_c0_seq1.p1  ORF type:complete len:503 (-),score=71.07 gnl/TRDRNA2_/TRDRNA2_31830_c0_seq1:71-1471(-)